MRPNVSVIIPTYNRKDLVSEAISSVLKQTYQNFEIIVIDDGSTDDTENSLRALIQTEKINYIKTLHRGISHARNTGISSTKGPYIAFLDNDDLWLPKKLERQIAILEKDPSIGIIYTDEYIETDGVKLDKTRLRIYTPRRGIILKYLLRENFIQTSSVVVRKKCLNDVGYFSTKLEPADFDLWYRIAGKYKADFIDEPLVICRSFPDSTSRQARNSAEDLYNLVDWHLQNNNFIRQMRFSDRRYCLDRYLDLADDFIRYVDDKNKAREVAIYYWLKNITYFKPLIFYFMTYFYRIKWLYRNLLNVLKIKPIFHKHISAGTNPRC